MVHSKQFLLSFKAVSRGFRGAHPAAWCVAVLLWTIFYTKMEREGPCCLLLVSEGDRAGAVLAQGQGQAVAAQL